MFLSRAEDSSSLCSFSFVRTLIMGFLIVVTSSIALAQNDVNLRISNDETLRYSITQTCPPTAPSSCVTQVKAIGLFSKYAGKDLQEFVRTLPQDGRPVAIHFSSLGGNLAGGLQVGQLLREYEFITQTGFEESVCYSACAYAFMGGSIRQLGPQAKLGLHQFYSQTNELNASKAQNISALISNYLSYMGIDQEVLKLALGTRPNQLVIVNKNQAKLLKIDNSHNPYNPWKLEATTQGVLAVMTTERQPNRPWLVTALVSRIDGQVRLMMQLKNTQANASIEWLSNLNAQYQIRVVNKNIPLKLVRSWQMVQASTAQAWFEIPSEVLNAWGQASPQNDSGSNSQALTWQFLIISSDPHLQANQLKTKTSLGFTNFPASWQALNRSRQ